MKDDDAVKQRDFVTTTEAAEMLGVSYYTVYEYIREKRIVAELVGGVYLMPTAVFTKVGPCDKITSCEHILTIYDNVSCARRIRGCYAQR